MQSRRYQAIEVRQQPNARPMYLIAVSAAELLQWCDVPRTKEDYMAGYQRIVMPGRPEEIAEYLRQSDRNVLPGAIIVAADEEYVKVVRENDAVFLEVNEDVRDLETKIQELFGAFSTRLSLEELRSANIVVHENSEDEGDGDESEYPASYLATLAQELNSALLDWTSLEPERRKAIADYIQGVSKPGLIIDGQHRVLGAKNVSEHDITLPIVVMVGLPHEEQVFQFYVLNSKARPLRPTELRRIISTSLTNSEIEALYSRFKSAGVEANEARWTFEVNNSPRSVFKGLIDFGFSQLGTVIPENVADQLVRGFMKMPSSRYSVLIRHEAVARRWNDPEQRLQIFFDFWTSIADVYEDIWRDAIEASTKREQKQIFMKVALLTLQRFVLDRFVTALPFRGKGAAQPFENIQATKEMVESTLQNLPSEFFSREWRQKQMDTSAGRQLLYEEMGKVWDNQGRNLGNMRLFRTL